MNASRYSGRCLCGRIRYRISGAVRDLVQCHCESCRRAAGAACVAWGTTDRGAFELLQGELAVMSSSPDVERGFCGHCGTTLTFRRFSVDGELDFTLASLDDPAALKPDAHIWVSEKLPWLTIADGLPQYATGDREPT